QTNSVPNEILTFSDGKAKVIFQGSSSRIPRSNSYRSSRSEERTKNSFHPSRNSTSSSFKGVDFTPIIPNTFYQPKEKEEDTEQSESPTFSDMVPPSNSDLDHQCKVISSEVDRRKEFKYDQNIQVKNFQKIFRNQFSSKEKEQFWEDYFESSTELSFYDWIQIKVFGKQPEKSQVLTTKTSSKSWKTPDGNRFQSIHPPLQDISFTHGKTEILASPLKRVPNSKERLDESQVVAKDIKNIQAQNNFTNIVLQSVCSQLNRIESNSESETSTVPKDSFKEYRDSKSKDKNISKPSSSSPIFKNDDIIPTFGKSSQSLSTENEVLSELVNQLKNFHVSKNNNTIDLDEIENQFVDKKIDQINKLRNSDYQNIPKFYPRPSFPDQLFEEKLPPQRSYDGSS
ncbi:Hypothetical predicted protein, partial [Olea europaea subsp. europaea]